VDDWAFVRRDGVGSVFERGANVVDGRLAGFDVEGGSFEYDVGLGGVELAGPGTVVGVGLVPAPAGEEATEVAVVVAPEGTVAGVGPVSAPAGVEATDPSTVSTIAEATTGPIRRRDRSGCVRLEPFCMLIPSCFGSIPFMGVVGVGWLTDGSSGQSGTWGLGTVDISAVDFRR